MPEALDDQLTPERPGCSNNRTASRPGRSHGASQFRTKRATTSKNGSDCGNTQSGSRGTSGCVSASVNKTAHTAHGLAHCAGWWWRWPRRTICILGVSVPFR